MTTNVKAIATFLPMRNNIITGYIQFEQSIQGGPTTIYGYIKGLSVGKHGIHIHQYGDLSNGCESAGPHYNPYGKTHGGPGQPNRHVGDLGNIECRMPGELVTFHLVDPLVSLIGPTSVIGRTLIIHADEDDLGQTSHPLSKTTGNSGERIACAIIGIKG